MTGEWIVTEYVPRKVTRARLVCKCLLIGCMAAMGYLFRAELGAAARLREQCDRIEAEVLRREALMEDGDEACEGGDRILGERCYLTALKINPGDGEPYLKLAQIYREIKRYDLALEILEEYSGKDGAVDDMRKKLRKEIEELEVSEFRSLEEGR